MTMYEAKVEMTTVCYDAVFVLPCVSSAKAAIEIVHNLEKCPLNCLKVISLKEVGK